MKNSGKTNVLVSWIIILAMVMMLIPSGFVYAEELSGTCGDGVEWTYSDGLLTISGEGKIRDYKWTDTKPWESVRDDITEVVIEDGVIKIGRYAFYNAKNIESVTIADSVEVIEDYAFCSVTNLRTVDMPKYLSYLGAYAFSQCVNLESIVIPDGLTETNELTFQSCNSLTEVTIPSSVVTIANSTFHSCKNLKKVDIREGVQTIGECAFYNCPNLSLAKIPQSVTSIGPNSFSNKAGMVIQCYSGSEAEAYAKLWGIQYMPYSSGNSGGGGGGSTEPLTEIKAILSFDENTFLESEKPLKGTITALTNISEEEGYVVPEIVYEEKIEISQIGENWYYIPLDTNPSNLLIQVMFDPCGGTNVYTAEEFLYTPEGGMISLLDTNFDEHYYDITQFGPEINMVMPSGQTFDGQIVSDGGKAVDEFFTYVSFEKVGGGFNKISPVWVKEDLSFEGVLPGGITDGCYKVSLTTGSSISVSNLLGGHYYAGEIDEEISPDPVVEITPSAGLSDLVFEVPAGYAVSGEIQFPEDTILENAVVRARLTAGDYDIWIFNPDDLKKISLDKLTVPYMIGIPKDLENTPVGTVSLNIEVYEANKGEKGFNCNLYTGDYYYGGDETVLNADEAKQVVFEDDISGVDIDVQTKISMNVEVKRPSVSTDILAGMIYITDKNGNEITETGFWMDASSSSATAEFVLPSGYEDKEVYAYYRLNSNIANDNADVYKGKAYINSDGTVSPFKKDANTITIDNGRNISYTVAATEDMVIPEAVDYDGSALESAHPYPANKTTHYKYAYTGDEIADKLKVTFSPKSNLYWTNASFRITDGNGNTVTYDYEAFNSKVSGETLIIDGNHFSIVMVHGHATTSADNSYGFAITNIEPVSNEDITDPDEPEEPEEPGIDPNDPDYGYTEFITVSANDGKTPVSGATVSLTNSEGEEIKYTTDADGKVSEYIPVGKWSVSVFKSGLITRNFDAEIIHGEENKYTVGLSDKPLVEVKTTSKVMTYDEIIDAGIDVDDPENNHVVKYDIKLKFGTEIKEITTYFDSTNSYVGKTEKYTFHLTGGTTVNVYPVSKNFYLVVYGEIQWLKEMFDVEMLIVNNSMTDTVEECTAELVLPEGLSLAAMVGEEQTLKQDVPSIGYGGSHSVHWYVRGDKEGEYQIGATLNAVLEPLGEKINETYKLEEPIKVYAGKAMHMDIYVPDMTFYGDEYPVRIELTNVSDRTLYNVSNSIKYFEEGYVTYYSNGEITSERTYFDEGTLAKIGAQEFKPGDKIVLEVVADIQFTSDILKAKISDVGEYVKNVDDLLRVYDAYISSVEETKNAYDALNSFMLRAREIMDSNVYTDEKAEAVSNLYSVLERFTQAGSLRIKERMDTVRKMKTTGIYDKISKIFETEDVFASFTASEINEICDRVLILTDSEELNQTKPEEDKLFELLVRAVESIPVRYYLEDVIVSTLEGSTTTIPCTVHTVSAKERFFDIEVIDTYLDNIVRAAMGKTDIPWNAGLIGIEDPDIDQEENIVLIKGEATKFAITDNSGELTTEISVDAANIGKLEISATNGTTVDENGDIIVTGAGYIEVKPLDGAVDGQIVMCGKTFNFTVVDAHDCSSDDWEVIVSPEGDSIGYKVKRCDICKRMIDIAECEKACKNHVYGEYTTDTQPDGSGLGIKRRECERCGRIQYLILDPSVSFADLVLTPDCSLTVEKSDGTVRNVLKGMTPREIVSHFENANIEIVTPDGNVVSADSKVGTGCKVVVKNEEDGTTSSELSIAVKGDVTGRGEVDVFDMVKLFNHVTTVSPLEDLYLKAALIDDNDEIDIVDLVMLFNAINSGKEFE